MILGMLFIVFVSYILAYNSGYYELSNSKKAIITNEKKEEFERDLENNQVVDIKNYLGDEYVDYSSSMSRVGSSLSNSLNNFIESGLSEFIGSISKLFV